jgi:hypothetical protein
MLPIVIFILGLKAIAVTFIHLKNDRVGNRFQPIANNERKGFEKSPS